MAAALAAHLAGATPAADRGGRANVSRRRASPGTGAQHRTASPTTTIPRHQRRRHLKAIDAFPGGLWIILGGKDKNSDYTVLRDPLARTKRARRC